MTDDIIARLRTMGSYPHKRYPTHYANPDGPDAAKVIEALAGRIAVLEGHWSRLLGPWMNGAMTTRIQTSAACGTIRSR